MRPTIYDVFEGLIMPYVTFSNRFTDFIFMECECLINRTCFMLHPE